MLNNNPCQEGKTQNVKGHIYEQSVRCPKDMKRAETVGSLLFNLLAGHPWASYLPSVSWLVCHTMRKASWVEVWLVGCLAWDLKGSTVRTIFKNITSTPVGQKYESVKGVSTSSKGNTKRNISLSVMSKGQQPDRQLLDCFEGSGY